MKELGQRFEIRAYASEVQQRCSQWAPYRTAVREDETRNGNRLGGVSVLGALLLFSGITFAVARESVGLAESYQISPAALLGIAWLLQGAAALLCFVLAVRWLRS